MPDQPEIIGSEEQEVGEPVAESGAKSDIFVQTESELNSLEAILEATAAARSVKKSRAEQIKSRATDVTEPTASEPPGRVVEVPDIKAFIVQMKGHVGDIKDMTEKLYKALNEKMEAFKEDDAQAGVRVEEAVELISEIENLERIRLEDAQKINSFIKYVESAVATSTQKLLAEHGAESVEDMRSRLDKLTDQTWADRDLIYRHYHMHPIRKIRKAFGREDEDIKEARRRLLANDVQRAAIQKDYFELLDLKQAVIYPVGGYYDLEYSKEKLIAIINHNIGERIENVTYPDLDQTVENQDLAISQEAKKRIELSLISEKLKQIIDSYHIPSGFLMVEGLTKDISEFLIAKAAQPEKEEELVRDLGIKIEKVCQYFDVSYLSSQIERIPQEIDVTPVAKILQGDVRFEMIQLINRQIEIADRFVTTTDYSSGWYSTESLIRNKKTELEGAKKNALAPFMLDPDLWNAFRSDPEVIDRFTKERLDQVEKMIIDARLEMIFDKGSEMRHDAAELELQLTKFKNVEALPILTFFAYTQPGGSGERPLMYSSRSDVPNAYNSYVAGLDQEELKAFLAREENTGLRRLIQNSRSPLGARRIYDESFRRIQGKNFARVAERLLSGASRREKISLYAHLAYTANEVSDGQGDIIEMALQEPVIAKDYLQRYLTKDNCRYAARIFDAAPESEHIDYINHMKMRLTSDSIEPGSLDFLPGIVERSMENLNFIESLKDQDRNNILMLLSMAGPSEVYGKFLKTLDEKKPIAEAMDNEFAQSLARASVHGKPEAIEYLTKYYEGAKDPKSFKAIADAISSEIGRWTLIKNLEDEEQINQRKKVIDQHLNLLRDGTSQQKRFVALILNNIFKSAIRMGNAKTQKRLDAIFLDQATAMQSLLEQSDDLVMKMILLDNKSGSNVDEVDIELALDSLAKMHGAIPEESSIWGLRDIVSDIIRNREKHPQESIERLCKIILENMQASDVGLKFVVAEHYAGRLSEENTALLESSRIPEYDFAKNNPEQTQPITKDNWVIYLSGFVRSMGGTQVQWIEDYFKDPEVMSFVFENYRKAYLDHIQKLTESKSNVDAVLLARLIQKNEGAGHLRHIQAMAGLIEGMDSAFLKGHTAFETKRQLGQMLMDQEAYFDKNRWGNEDRSYFYGVTKEILGASPALYKDFDRIFKQLNPKELEDFVENIYPLFQAQLVVLEQKQPPKNPEVGALGTHLPEEAKEYSVRDLLPIRNLLKDFSDKLELGNDRVGVIEEFKKETLSRLQVSFKDRLGFDKLPEKMEVKDIRALKDILIYLGNIKSKDEEKTALLMLFLALTVNGKWDQFRQGKMFRGDDLEKELVEYFSADNQHYKYIKEYLKERDKAAFIPTEVIGLSDQELAEIQPILQEEVIVQHLGNIRTVDDKLEGILLALEVYADPDTYPEEMRPYVSLVEHYSSSKVNSALAKKIQIEMGKDLPISEEELNIVEEFLAVDKLNSDMPVIEKLKSIQSTVKLATTSMNLVEKRTEYRKLVDALRAKLVPNANIVRIFNDIGEEFKTDSGARAISQDLIYLESIASKNQEKITEKEDKDAIAAYLQEIREQMTVLEKAILEIENKLKTMLDESQKQGATQYQTATQEVLRNLRGSDSALTINSNITNSWIPIIENMRQCLACNTTGCNNDTNLTFGDPNKFYLYSQDANKDANEGSISDEIVFFEPITIGEQQEMSFVFDQIYGNHSPDILYGHLAAVTKKLAAIKAKAPKAKVSIFITDSALSTAGLSRDILTKRFGSEQSAYIIEPVEATVNVVPSPGGDHYVEFRGGGRISGNHSAGGLRMRLRSEASS